MSTEALLFMTACWTGVLGLATWSLRRVLRADGRRRTVGPDDSASPEARS